MTKTVTGFYTKGSWELARQVEPGWGVNNSGGPIDAGGYIADFNFAWPTDSAAVTELSSNRQSDAAGASGFACPRGQANGVVGTCWRMKGYYDGFHNLLWAYVNRSDITGGAFVKVFNPRSSR